MKSEIKSLAKRVTDLGTSQNQEPSLSTEEANNIRWFWIQLHYTPEEAEEEATLRKRQDILFELLQAGKKTPEGQEEWSKVSSRLTQIAHNLVMQRVIDNHAMRDRVWPELAPRVLRFYKLTEKPAEQLTQAEGEELKGLLEWFTKLQQEALESVGAHT